MRIAAVNSCATFGGREQWTAALLRALAERGHATTYFCRPEIAARIAPFGVPTTPVHLGGDLALYHAIRFSHALAAIRPHALLIAHYPKIWLAGMAARLAKVPRVVTRIDLSAYHARTAKYRIALERFVDYTTANSDAMRRAVAAQCAGLSPDRLLTIYDGVNTPVVTDPENPLRARLGIRDDAFVIGTLARLHWRKSHQRTLRALAQLPSDTHVVIAGEGPERPTLDALAARLGIANRVHLLGHRTDVGDVLHALDIYVVASHHEGMSNAMLEAMASALPVLSTPVSGADEALGSAPGAVPPGEIFAPNADALAERLAWYRERRHLLRDMGLAATERVQRHFTFERMVDQWEALLAGEPDTVSRVAVDSQRALMPS